VTTFLVNYKGRPYMVALKDNKLLLYTLMVGWVTIHAAVLNPKPQTLNPKSSTLNLKP
jgi:hypothetical protein